MMLTNINELQPRVIQTIRGTVSIELFLGAEGAVTQMGPDTFIDLGNDDSITLLNFAVEDLNPGNFALV